jgi:hypothetical protein
MDRVNLSAAAVEHRVEQFVEVDVVSNALDALARRELDDAAVSANDGRVAGPDGLDGHLWCSPSVE